MLQCYLSTTNIDKFHLYIIMLCMIDSENEFQIEPLKIYDLLK